jgi:hypothetical protein
MRPEWENYRLDHVIFQGTTEPHHNITKSMAVVDIVMWCSVGINYLVDV